MSRRGRPPLDRSDSSVRVCVTVPSRRYDALDRDAGVARVSIPELIRRSLERDAREKKYLNSVYRVRRP